MARPRQFYRLDCDYCWRGIPALNRFDKSQMQLDVTSAKTILMPPCLNAVLIGVGFNQSLANMVFMTPN